MNSESILNFTLENGLKVILLPSKEAKSVSLYLTVRAGPRYEDKDNAGLAHFLEHMLFEGTKRFPTPRKLADYIESVGGRSGAWTDKEYITYYVKILPENVERGIDYLSDIIFNSKIDNKNIEKEKRIVLEEMKRKIDNPELETFDLWMELVWGKSQSLGRSTIGNEKTINNLNKEKIKSYLNQFYFPSNMAIVIVGKFSEKKILQNLNNYFRVKNRVKLPKIVPITYESDNINIKAVHTNIEQVQIICGFVTNVSYSNDDKYSLMLLAEILGGSSVSRLFHKLVYELGIAYTSYTYPWTFRDTGLFIIYTAVSSNNVDVAIKTILSEINNIKTKIIPEKELNLNKEKIKARFYLDTETTDSVANFYSTQLITEGSITTFQQIIDKVEKIKTADLLRVANKYFKSEKLSLLIRGKIGSKSKQNLKEEFIKSRI